MNDNNRKIFTLPSKKFFLLICLIFLMIMLYSCGSVNKNIILNKNISETDDSIVTTVFNADALQNGTGGGLSKGCIHDMLDKNGMAIDDSFYESYHTVSGILSAYVGYDESGKWFNEIIEKAKFDPEIATINSFLNQFNITRD